MVAKVEYLSGGENPRFIVTSIPLEQCEGRELYEQRIARAGTWRTASKSNS